MWTLILQTIKDKLRRVVHRYLTPLSASDLKTILMLQVVNTVLNYY